MKNVVIKTALLLVWLGCGIKSYAQFETPEESMRYATVVHFADSLLQRAGEYDADGKTYLLEDYIRDSRCISSLAKKLGTRTPSHVTQSLYWIVEAQRSFGPSATNKKYPNLHKNHPALCKLIPLLWAVLLVFGIIFLPDLVIGYGTKIIEFTVSFMQKLKSFSLKPKHIDCLLVLPVIKQEWHYGFRRWGDISLSVDHVPWKVV